MQITDLTTYPDVRAVLGVSDEEIEDVELALSIWSTNMTLRLLDLTPTFETLYDGIKDTAEGSRTPIQQRFYITSNLYAAYLVADDLLTSLPMFSFKSITDGKAETERFDRWEDVRDGVKLGLGGIRARLLLMLQTLEGTPVPTVSLPGLIAGVPLGFDPVTGA
jgi:hypothetical protein